jgi:hypothetical protein
LPSNLSIACLQFSSHRQGCLRSEILPDGRLLAHFRHGLRCAEGLNAEIAGQAGVDAFFQKPVDFQQVAVGLRRIMARDV